MRSPGQYANYETSRREFLKLAAAGGAALVAPGCGPGEQAAQGQPQDSPKTVSKRVVLCSDTHWGGREDDGIAEDDIADWIRSTIGLYPDYVFHLGDITDHAKDKSFLAAKRGFDEIVSGTKIDRIWQIAGGWHDGLYGISRGAWQMGFHRILNNTSQWYTLKLGNIVFVMLGYFAQPGSWSTGAYGGTERADLMNQNKVDWLARTLRKWDGRGYNIIICRHFPLHGTHILTNTWANMGRDRFVHECAMIQQLLRETRDVVAWFGAHIHVDSFARYDDGPGASDGTILSGAARPDLPSHVHYISVGDIWREHGQCWDSGLSTVANFRYLDLREGGREALLHSWDATHNAPTKMSVSSPGGLVDEYAIPLRYPLVGIDQPIEYEQAWDVWRYSDEKKCPWYQDNQGLRRDSDGWIESRWDLWKERDFSGARLVVDTTSPQALTHRINYSLDGMETWSEASYSPETLREMPRARWVRIKTNIATSVPLIIRDIEFRFPEQSAAGIAKPAAETTSAPASP